MIKKAQEFDIFGQRFSRLIAVQKCTYKDKHNHTLWLCRCDCGGEAVVPLGELRAGRRKSCGCILAVKTCSVAGCGQKHMAKGMCQDHYNASPERKDKCRVLNARRRKDPKYRIKDNISVHKRARARRAVDLLFRFKENVRALLRGSFLRKGFSQNSHTAQILGCSFEEAFGRIGWFPGCEIHHVAPLEIAKTEEDVIRLNHYTNLVALTVEQHTEIHMRMRRCDAKSGF